MSFLVKSVQKRVSGKEGTGQKIALQKDTQRKRKKRSITETLFFKCGGNKDRILQASAHPYHPGPGGTVSMYDCEIGTLACWTAGAWGHGHHGCLVVLIKRMKKIGHKVIHARSHLCFRKA